MGESAVLFHSYSFASPLSRHESHQKVYKLGLQDNTIHVLTQSVSFGRFTTENLEWGKWSSFSHNKYVDEAEKYSQPGSVAQKKAFFDAYYKKIAEAKKAKAASDDSKQREPESVAVLLNTLETFTKDDAKEEEKRSETELVLSSEDLVVLSIEKDEEEEEEEPERKSVVVDLEQGDFVVDKDDLQDVVKVLDEMEQKEYHRELLKMSSTDEEKEEVIKNSSVFRLETPDKAMELVVTQKISENSIKNNEKSVRSRFSFLNRLLMGNTKAQHKKAKRKTDKKPNKPFLCLCFNPEMVR